MALFNASNTFGLSLLTAMPTFVELSNGAPAVAKTPGVAWINATEVGVETMMASVRSCCSAAAQAAVPCGDSSSLFGLPAASHAA